MVDDDKNRKRLLRVQQLKAADSTMTSSRALGIIRKEEAQPERASQQEAQATTRETNEESRAAQEERRAAKETEKAEREKSKAARETEKAERERGKAAKEDIDKDKAEENFFKKLLSRKSGAGEGSKETINTTGGSSWVSLALIIIGIGAYLLRISTAGASSVAFILSLFLFLLSGIAIAHFAQKDKLAVLVPMLLFVVWYFVFKGNYNPGFLVYFLPIAAGILVIPTLFTKGESITPELLGLVPVLFLFLDIGLIPFLIENLKLPVTPLMQSLVLFMPWWALLGLFTLPGGTSKSTSANALIGFLRIMGILYIMFILIAPAVPGLGYDKSLLPETGEFEAAQQRLRATLPQRENPAWSNLACIFSEPANVQGCVERRQELSELTSICEKVEGKVEGTPQFTECINEQRQKKKDVALQVQGTIDPTIKKPTKARCRRDVVATSLIVALNQTLYRPLSSLVGKQR